MMTLYKKQLQELLQRAHPQLEKKHNLEFKNCFGAVAGYLDGHIFCSCGKFGFALKLPQGDVEKLLDFGAKPLRYFPNGRVKKDYAVLPKKIMQNPDKLKDLIALSARFVA